jgi:hypothetical protein
MRGVCVYKNGPKGPVHRAPSVREFLASAQITMLEHPPYSPDLATNDGCSPNDCFLFPNVKEILKGSHFDDDDIRSNTTAALKTSSKIVLKG